MRSSGSEEDGKGQCVSRVIALLRAVIYTAKVLAAFLCLVLFYFFSLLQYFMT